MFNKLSFNDPDKFTGGIGTLWRGFNPITSFHPKLFSTASFPNDQLLTFFSARKSIYHILRFHSQKQPSKKEVIVSSFTCDAVVNSIYDAGLIPVFVSPSDSFGFDLSLVQKVNTDTLAIILQHTLGTVSLSLDDVSVLSDSSVPIIHDFCLSPVINLPSWIEYTLSSTDQYIILSFEYSKSITIGQGGLVIASKDCICSLRSFSYDTLPCPSIFFQLRTLLGSLLTSILSRLGIPVLGSVIWAFLVSFGFVLRSNYLSPRVYSYIRPGFLYDFLIKYSFSFLPSVSIQQNINARKIHSAASSNTSISLCNLDSTNLTTFSSPRIAFTVPLENHVKCYDFFMHHNVKLGRWFNDSPCHMLINSGYNNIISSTSNRPVYCFNFSTYASMSKREISHICNVISSYH